MILLQRNMRRRTPVAQDGGNLARIGPLARTICVGLISWREMSADPIEVKIGPLRRPAFACACHMIAAPHPGPGHSRP
jgi:hypothetical protein